MNILCKTLMLTLAGLPTIAWTTKSHATCPTSSTVVAIYQGTGTDAYANKWMTDFWDWWMAANPSLSYVTMTESELKGGCSALNTYGSLRLFVIGGGDAYSYQTNLGAAGAANINNFINTDGKAYLGICAGFWYTMNGYYWAGRYYAHPFLLKRNNPGEGWLRLISFYPGHVRASVSFGSGKMLYAGGPSYGVPASLCGYNGCGKTAAGAAPGTQLGYYNAGSYNGLTAGRIVTTANNRMLLFSVHPEADNYGIPGTFTAAEILANRQYLAGQINAVMGTSYTIPSS